MDWAGLWGLCQLISALSSPPLWEREAEAPQSQAAQPCASTVSFRACLKHRLPRKMSGRASRETKKRKFYEL